jgi:hypothetical protein
MFKSVTDMRGVTLGRRIVVATIAKRMGIMISPFESSHATQTVH